MARLSIEPRTSDLRVRCPTEWAMRPGIPVQDNVLVDNNVLADDNVLAHDNIHL